jgi:hypothetical protein
MPYEVQSDPFLSQLAGGMAGFLSGREQARQQRVTEEQRAKDEALQQAYMQQQLEAGAAETAQKTKVEQFQAGLQLPKNWTQMKPDDQINYLRVRQTEAGKRGDQTTIDNAQKQIDSIIAQQYKGAETAEIYQGKIPLAQARTQRAKQEHGEIMARVQMELRTRSAADQARIRAAGINAAARAQGAGLSLDERLLIQGLTQQNMLQGKSESDAFTAAMAQWKAEVDQIKKANVVSAAEGLPQTPIPAAPTPQSLNLNLSGLGGGGGGDLGAFVPALAALARDNPQLFGKYFGGAAAGGTPPTGDSFGAPPKPTTLPSVKTLLDRGFTPQQIIQKATQLQKQGKITRAQLTQMMRDVSYPQ